MISEKKILLTTFDKHFNKLQPKLKPKKLIKAALNNYELIYTYYVQTYFMISEKNLSLTLDFFCSIIFSPTYH